jgi:hypothetical protein
MKSQIGYRLPFVLMLVLGIFFVAQYYIPHPSVQEPAKILQQWMNPLGGFIMFLGLVGIFIRHVKLVRRKERRWGYSVVTLVSMIAMMVAGFALGTEDDTVFADWFKYLLTPIEATIMSLLAFFVASAAFRAFRARTMNATVLLVSAFVVMLGLVPVVADVCTPVASISDFIFKYPATAAKRAILMGVALGAISVAIKTIVGIDRTILGRSR